jgi:hypothetical protein
MAVCPDNITDPERLGAGPDTNYLQAKAEAARLPQERASQASRGVAVIGFRLGTYYAPDLSVAEPGRIHSVVVFHGTGGSDYSRSRAHLRPSDSERGRYCRTLLGC